MEASLEVNLRKKIAFSGARERDVQHVGRGDRAEPELSGVEAASGDLNSTRYSSFCRGFSARGNGNAHILLHLACAPFAGGAATLWDRIAAGKLYYCSDSCGPIDFIPPFVHSVGGDYYIAPAFFVWLLWAAVLTTALALPTVAIGVSFWFYNRAKDQENES